MYAALSRRPKDLAGKTAGLDSCRDASHAWDRRDPSVARKRLCEFGFRVALPQEVTVTGFSGLSSIPIEVSAALASRRHLPCGRHLSGCKFFSTS
jgi:hypothetical protein